MKNMTILVALLLLGGCAGHLPREITHAPKPDPALTEVQSNLKAFQDAQVRWGGIVLQVQNKAQETEVELLATGLGREGRPNRGESSPGRFIAKIKGFLDPKVYTPGREMTVAGTVSGSRKDKIGDHEYIYVILKATTHYLWPPREEDPYYYYDPWPYYDPWYWYPWGYPYPRYFRRP